MKRIIKTYVLILLGIITHQCFLGTIVTSGIMNTLLQQYKQSNEGNATTLVRTSSKFGTDNTIATEVKTNSDPNTNNTAATKIKTSSDSYADNTGATRVKTNSDSDTGNTTTAATKVKTSSYFDTENSTDNAISFMFPSPQQRIKNHMGKWFGDAAINGTAQKVQTKSEDHLEESTIAINGTAQKVQTKSEEHLDETKKSKSILKYECTKSKQKCALLFFGLIQTEYQPLILPSIERNIISINPDCDIYVHTYNITSIPYNPRSNENASNTIMHPEDSYLLTKDHTHVQMDTVAEFWDQRGQFVNTTKKNYHKPWGKCCTSHINMIKQWHSIKGVWDLMRHHETLLLNKSDHAGHDNADTVHADDNNLHYEQIGLFRSDVYYPIPISIYEHPAGVPDFGHWKGINDRLFYGNRRNAQLWADRFAFQKVFHKKYMHKKWGYHSEKYLKKLLKHHHVQVTKNRNICVWRMRSGWRVKSNDCKPIGSESAHLPIGYTLKDKKLKIQKIVIDHTNHSTVNTSMGNKVEWLFDPILEGRRTFLLEKPCGNKTNTTHP